MLKLFDFEHLLLARVIQPERQMLYGMKAKRRVFRPS